MHVMSHHLLKCTFPTTSHHLPQSPTISHNLLKSLQQEVYLPPFAAAVRAGTAAIMCAYNRVRGSYACGNDHTLNTVLKGQLGFKGWVMSDWCAVSRPTA